MYNSSEELSIGSRFFQTRTYVGIVEFEVTNKDEETLDIKSVSSRGYDFVLTPKLFEESVSNGLYFYKDLSTAKEAKVEEDQKETEEFINRFKDDKALFTEVILQKAYQKEIDGEYGNYNEAMAIKALAEHHFPGLQIED